MSREAFEKSYAETHDLPLDTFSQYRMGDTYRLPGIASHWRTWQMALESVVVELPEPWDYHDHRLFIPSDIRSAIEAAGVRVKP